MNKGAETKKIVIDVGGADAGPEPIIEGAARALTDPDTSFRAVFCGNAGEIRKKLEGRGVSEDMYETVDTDVYVTNNDSPMCVMGEKEDSSLVLALKALKSDPDAAAMVSAGNTGAVMIGTIVHLGLIPGLRQPTLATVLPAPGGKFICIADCGANVDCRSDDMIAFALMGDEFMKCMFSVEHPRIGLLSVGTEIGKGSKRVLEAYEKIETLPLNFVGNIEGNDMMTDICDVIVCDGFSGNVILKNSEAVGKFAGAFAEETIRRCAAEKGEAPDEDLIAELRRSFYRQFDFNYQGGAFFFGTVKPVVKMHGAANASTAFSCIKQAIALDDKKFTDRLTTALDGKLPKRKFIRQQ